jgi:hypothetical protein
MLIRVGNTIINLDNVLTIDLDWTAEEGEDPQVVFKFNIRGVDELDEGQNVAEPWVEIFGAEEGEAIRQYLKRQVPDLLATK